MANQSKRRSVMETIGASAATDKRQCSEPPGKARKNRACGTVTDSGGRGNFLAA